MPAYCGKCGKELPTVGNVAVDAGHYCQKQLTGAQQVIVTFLATGEFIVSEGAQFADQLTWGEMLEMVIGLTHSDISSPRYRMRSPEAMAADSKRRGDNVTVVDAEYPDVATPDPIEPPVPYVPVAPLTDDETLDIPF
jgi:hypothetical protein